MTTITEIAAQAKAAIVDSKLILENTLEDLAELLVPFKDIPPGVTIAGISELNNMQMNIRNQLTMVDNSLTTFMTQEERNAKMMAMAPPMMAPPIMPAPTPT